MTCNWEANEQSGECKLLHSGNENTHKHWHSTNQKNSQQAGNMVMRQSLVQDGKHSIEQTTVDQASLYSDRGTERRFQKRYGFI